MIRIGLKYGLGSLGILILQVLVINNIYVFDYLHPYLYVWILLMLPMSLPNWAILLSGFSLGLLMDLFQFTPGLHSSATVLVAFIRPFLVSIMFPKEGITGTLAPHINTFGFTKYFTYALLVVFIHHLALFFLEVFSFEELQQTLLRVGLNTLVSLPLILTGEMLFFFKNQG